MTIAAHARLQTSIAVVIKSPICSLSQPQPYTIALCGRQRPLCAITHLPPWQRGWCKKSGLRQPAAGQEHLKWDVQQLTSTVQKIQEKLHQGRAVDDLQSRRQPALPYTPGRNPVTVSRSQTVVCNITEPICMCFASGLPLSLGVPAKEFRLYPTF